MLLLLGAADGADSVGVVGNFLAGLVPFGELVCVITSSFNFLLPLLLLEAETVRGRLAVPGVLLLVSISDAFLFAVFNVEGDDAETEETAGEDGVDGDAVGEDEDEAVVVVVVVVVVVLLLLLLVGLFLTFSFHWLTTFFASSRTSTLTATVSDEADDADAGAVLAVPVDLVSLLTNTPICVSANTFSLMR